VGLVSHEVGVQVPAPVVLAVPNNDIARQVLLVEEDYEPVVGLPNDLHAEAEGQELSGITVILVIRDWVFDAPLNFAFGYHHSKMALHSLADLMHAEQGKSLPIEARESGMCCFFVKFLVFGPRKGVLEGAQDTEKQRVQAQGRG
jgi:hypothetical protein